jgi:outer membrane protein assembly factor BamD (BamD/ComL family)
MKTAQRKIIFYVATLLIIAGVTACQKAPPAPSKPTPRTHSRADAIAAQKYYDQGLQEYSRENYMEARTLFQRVIDLDPNEELKSKAQENLKKTQQTLKSLDRIKAK